jgi:phospho-N-acetylmuramoyl-pentapeptide-transferase
MFYHLFYEYLIRYASYFNLFQYITFRAAYATVTALLISFLLGPLIIRRLRRLGVQQPIKTDGPSTHLVKEGTPTMGGILILVAIIVPTLLWGNLRNGYLWIALLSTLWMGLVGFADDYLKVVRELPNGLVGRYKLTGQILLGLIVGTVLYFRPLSSTEFATQSFVPFLKNVVVDFRWFYVPLVVFVITATSNAVNLTDGLDGLAIGLVGISALAFAVISYISGNVKFSDYLNVMYLPGSGELTIFCMAVVGAALGFLWFNAPPAEVWMGDTGALALGGALGVLAILVKKELLLVIIGGLFVAEVCSVILQVSYFKRRGKRLFRMAPIHHHFELKGWAESKVVVRFWIVGVLLALLSLSTFKIR